jgi:hypothetical protein
VLRPHEFGELGAKLPVVVLNKLEIQRREQMTSHLRQIHQCLPRHTDASRSCLCLQFRRFLQGMMLVLLGLIRRDRQRRQ